MPVSFSRIPAGIRVPLFYAEITNRAASYNAQTQLALLIGPMLPSGQAVPLEPVLVPTLDDAYGLFGAGSILADMVDIFRRNDSTGEMWCIPHADDPTAIKAVGAFPVTGPATGNGSIYGYIAGDRYVTNVSAGMTAEEIVLAMCDTVNLSPFCLVTAAPDGAQADVLVLTAKNAGLLGDQISVTVNLLGPSGGERFPPGVTVSGGPMKDGVGVAPMPELIAAMGDDEYDFICSPYNSTTDLDALDALMNDFDGRWAWDRQIYGGVFCAMQGTAQELVDFGRGNATAGTTGRNGPHVHILGYPVSASPQWRRAAALTGQAAVSLRNDPALPLQTLPLIGVRAPARGKGFKIGEKDTLLYSGISVEMQDFAGQVQIQRCISTYQKNTWGLPDPSWLDVQTSYTLMYVVRFLRQRLLQKFPRHKLADDGTPFGYGQQVATPSIIRGELVACYSELQSLALVENMASFKNNLIVERNQTDPNRVDILFPPDLINQLRVLALLVEFRLQYPPPALAAAA